MTEASSPTTPVEQLGEETWRARRAGAQAAYEEARIAIAEYRGEDARTHLVRADSLLTGDPSAEATELRLRIRISRTWETFARAPTATEAELRLVAAEARQRGLLHLVGLADMQRGVLLTRLGDLSAGREALMQAAEHERRLETADQVRLLVNRGVVRSMLLDLPAACDDLARAAALAQRAALDQLAFMAVHNRGYAEYLRGDLPEALRLMSEADALPVQVDRGLSRHDRARVLLEAGLSGDAQELLANVVESMSSAGLEAEADDALLDLARSDLLRGNAQGAAERAAQVAEGYAARGSTRRAVQARLLWLQAQAWQPGAAKLVTRARELTQSAARVDEREGEIAQTLLARVLLAAGRADEAADEARAATALTRRASLAERCLGRRVLVDIALATGHRDRAQRTLRSAATDLRAVRRGMSSLDLRTGLALHSAPLARADIALAVASGSGARVLTVTERWRTALGVIPQVRPAEDPPEAALWTRLRKLQEDERQAAPDQAATLRREAGAVMRRLRQASWARDLGQAEEGRAVTVREARAALAAGGADLLLLTQAEDRLVAVTAEPGDAAHLLDLAPVALVEKLARRATTETEALARVSQSVTAHGMRAGVEGSLQATLAELARVFAPALVRRGRHDEPAERPIVVVPTATLAACPWSMLPGLRARPVVVTRSLTHWVRHGIRVPTPRVAVLTGPALASGEVEARAIADRWFGRVQYQRDGTGAALRSLLTSCDLVHVAAHGRHEQQNPLFSSLLLADGPTYAHEVEGLRLRARHVVLSACRAGRSDVRPGDEPLGLTACLLAFGATTVVAPTAIVGDEVATTTMATYHRGLAAGLEAAVALAAARRDGGLLAGSFTCFGAPWRIDTDPDPASEINCG